MAVWSPPVALKEKVSSCPGRLTWRSAVWPQVSDTAEQGLLGRWKATLYAPVMVALVEGLTTTRYLPPAAAFWVTSLLAARRAPVGEIGRAPGRESG